MGRGASQTADSILYGNSSRHSQARTAVAIPQAWIDENKQEFKTYLKEAKKLREQLEAFAYEGHVNADSEKHFFITRNLVDDILEDKIFNDLSQSQYEQFKIQRQMEDDHFEGMSDRQQRIRYLDQLLEDIEQNDEDTVRTRELNRLKKEVIEAQVRVSIVMPFN